MSDNAVKTFYMLKYIEGESGNELLNKLYCCQKNQPENILAFEDFYFYKLIKLDGYHTQESIPDKLEYCIVKEKQCNRYYMCK